MKLKLTVFVAGAMALLALSILFIAPPATAQTEATPTPPPAAATPAPVLLTVTGVITNGTPGAANPGEGLAVNVYTFDPNGAMGSITTLTTTLSSDGTFEIKDVPSQAGWQVAASTTYKAVLYSSSLATVVAGQTTAKLPMTVYETTADTSKVSVEQMHVFFDFASDTLSVVELYIVSNSGDHAVVNPNGTVEFALPTGVSNLQVQGELEGVDFIRTEQGFAEIRSLAPGSGGLQILASFDLPYTGQLSFEQKMLYPVAAAGVLVPEGGVKLTSSMLQDEGLQNMQNTPYRIYGAVDMQAGSTLAFQLSGQPSAAASTSGTAATPAVGGLDSKSLGIGIGVLGLVVVILGVWFYRRQARPTAAMAGGRSKDDLIQAIADLDDAFENGEMEAPIYERRRATLKSELMELMAGEK